MLWLRFAVLPLFVLPATAGAQPTAPPADSAAATMVKIFESDEPRDIRTHVIEQMSVRIVTPETGVEEVRRQRSDAMLNGALIALGAVGILDNVIAHWILELHRAVPGEHALAVEIGIVIVSAAMLGVGIHRERRARRAATP